ncbi:hypothetical protein [Streptomyces sp900116325]|uniref:hypothetical protein n=1 Tax=Streptomyces sp. 900116325 TaxID=3154295 RepID=UPI003326EF34
MHDLAPAMAEDASRERRYSSSHWESTTSSAAISEQRSMETPWTGPVRIDSHWMS